MRKNVRIFLMVFGVALLVTGCGKDAENKNKDTAKESKSEAVPLEYKEKDKGSEDEFQEITRKSSQEQHRSQKCYSSTES